MGATRCSGGSGPGGTLGHVGLLHGVGPLPGPRCGDRRLAHRRRRVPAGRQRVPTHPGRDLVEHAAVVLERLGQDELDGTASATARPWPRGPQLTPALWLLDPVGCTSLALSGGSQVTVGTSTVPGILTVDSNGSTCQSNQRTVSVSGTGTTLAAPCPSADRRWASSSCSACPRPPPRASRQAWARRRAIRGTSRPGGCCRSRCRWSSRATRARVDDVYNCQATRIPPTKALYHGITLVASCDPTSTTPPYVDNLKTAVGTTGLPSVAPAGVGTVYQRWHAVVQLQCSRDDQRVRELVDRLSRQGSEHRQRHVGRVQERQRGLRLGIQHDRAAA